MAQTGYTPILIYSSSTSSNAPAAGNLTNSTLGSELAINITDGKLFYKDNANAVQVIGWKVTPTSAGGTGLTSYSAGDTLYYASGTTLSKLAIGSSGYYMSSSGTAPQWSAPAALTKTDDTNVTLTLGGSASTALLNAASLTLGWTGQLGVSRGGTSYGSYTAGDILYASGTTALSKLGIGTNGQVLKSNGTAPTWADVTGVAVTSISFGTTGLTPSTATQGAVTVAGTLVAANGGTGQSSYAVGDILYASGSTTLSKLADVATGNALISGGVGVAPSWGKIGLTTHVSGTLPVANGGTNLTSFTSGGVMYASSTSALATSSNLTFDGTDLTAGGNIKLSSTSKGFTEQYWVIYSSTKTLNASTATNFATVTNPTGSTNVCLKIRVNAYVTTNTGGTAFAGESSEWIVNFNTYGGSGQTPTVTKLNAQAWQASTYITATYAITATNSGGTMTLTATQTPAGAGSSAVDGAVFNYSVENLYYISHSSVFTPL